MEIYLKNNKDLKFSKEVENLLTSYKNLFASDPCQEFTLFVQIFDCIFKNSTFKCINKNIEKHKFIIGEDLFSPININGNEIYETNNNNSNKYTETVTISFKQLLFYEFYFENKNSPDLFNSSKNLKFKNYERVKLNNICGWFGKNSFPENYIYPEPTEKCNEFMYDFIIKFILYIHNTEPNALIMDFFSNLEEILFNRKTIVLKNKNNIEYLYLNLRHRIIFTLLSYNYCDNNSKFTHQEALNCIQCYLSKKTPQKRKQNIHQDQTIVKKVHFGPIQEQEIMDMYEINNSEEYRRRLNLFINPAAQPYVDLSSSVLSKPFVLYLKLLILNKIMSKFNVKEQEITLAIYVIGITLFNKFDTKIVEESYAFSLLITIFIFFKTTIKFKFFTILIYISIYLLKIDKLFK